MTGPRRTIDSYFRRKSSTTVTTTTAAREKTSSALASEPSRHPYSQKHSPQGEPVRRPHNIATTTRPFRRGKSTAAVEEEGGLENDDNDSDPYDLLRFLSAQSDPPSYQGSYAAALSQLRRGRKTSHWVWYVLPQMPLSRGLGGGLSQMSRYYGIRSLAEARAYLAHDVLGARLREVTRAILDSRVADVEVLMGGETDAAKLLSCMTLFARAVRGGGSIGVGTSSEGGGRDVVGTSRTTTTTTTATENENDDNIFRAVIDKYFGGETDEVTERALDEEQEG